jgi:hypothetical protein
MPVVDGIPVPERWRHIPPRDTTTGPPEHPVEHRAVIGPPATAARDLVGQQRFQTSSFRIGQVVSMQHPPGLRHPALKIRGTRSEGERRPSAWRRAGCSWSVRGSLRGLPSHHLGASGHGCRGVPFPSPWRMLSRRVGEGQNAAPAAQRGRMTLTPTSAGRRSPTKVAGSPGGPAVNSRGRPATSTSRRARGRSPYSPRPDACGGHRGQPSGCLRS